MGLALLNKILVEVGIIFHYYYYYYVFWVEHQRIGIGYSEGELSSELPSIRKGIKI